MCVCVPTQAIARPSTCHPIATFSLVASACMSTSTASALPRSSARTASISANGDRTASRKTSPDRFTTPSRIPFASTTVCPRPGLPFGKLDGRTIRGSRSRYSYTSRWRYAWLPSVIASTPASNISRAVWRVIPRPPAAFSPFTTTKSGRRRSRSPGSTSASVRLPIPPTTSPTKRSFTSVDSANLRTVETATATTIAARDLVKRYGDRVALRGVSLVAGRGELVAVIGPNGAGKTTLLSILAGIQPADGGKVDAPASIGWVPQQPALYGKLTVEENLMLFARLERAPDPHATVDRMLELTDLRDRADDQVATLSGGNRQRVNIAIGLLGQPDVLLLDEPSAALDPRQRERLWEFILRLAGEGTTVVYATHHIQEAERYAGRLLVLADGERLFTGSPAELERVVGAGAGGVAERDFESAFVEFLRQRGH